jgi:polysaccharide biosynthesis PFTS motif protein
MTVCCSKSIHLVPLLGPVYRNCIKKLADLPNFIGVDAEIAAQELIENCEVVISMPFTSTALIARDFGKKSVYYDPKGILMKDDRAAHGIIIFQGEQQLMRWLKSNIKR